MNAKIEEHNKEFYDAEIFALHNKENQCLVFDINMQKLSFVKMCDDVDNVNKRKIFIFDSDTNDEWIEDKEIAGYSWILNCGLENIKNNKIPEEILEKCRKMQEKVSISQQFEIKNQHDIDILMNVAFVFHDSYIEKIDIEKNVAFAIINNSGWGIIIHLKLTNAKFSPLFKKNYGKMGEIFYASMFFENGKIYWTNDREIKSTKDFYEDLCWFSATKVECYLELV